MRALPTLRTLILLIAAMVAQSILAGAPASAQALASPQASVEPGRDVRTLASDWEFRFGGADDAAAAASEDLGWQPVSMPHSWNRLGGRPARDATDDMRRGKGWYRLRFQAAPLDGKRAFLQFDGASIVTDVWLNGTHLGQHKGAFARFRFDASMALRPGENILVVRTDNSATDEAGSANREVIPIARDWFMFGGLYRQVSLIVTDPVHIDMLYHGSPGLFARTVEVRPDQARISVRALLRNDDSKARRVTVTTAIVDAQGQQVAEARVSRKLAPSATTAAVTPLAVSGPHLWNGVADPYLYKVTVTITDRRQKLLDRSEQPLGIREMQLDPKRGFVLNGKVTPLRGVAMHQDRMDRGWAVTMRDHQQDLEMVRELGANAVRLAHYQHDQAVYDLADRLGLVVWTELPLVNRASPEDSATTTGAFKTNAEEQLRELIRQNFNHPSVAVWGVGNEVNFDAAMRGSAIQTIPLIRSLDALAKQEDPSRPTVLADCCGAFGDGLPGLPARSKLDTLIGLTDAIGVNRYFGWYARKPAFLTEDLDRLRALNPALPLAISEYGGGGALTQHSDDPTGGPINSIGRPHPEEYQAWLHEQLWPQIARRSDLWASWIWAMFDFASPMRQEGDLFDTNNKGLVSYDRRTRKDAFFYYKAQWNPEPMAHLTGARHVVRAYPYVDVKAYSNAASLRLTVNGRDLGSSDCPARVCTWRNVPLDVGANAVAVTGIIGGKPVRDALVWQRPPSTTLFAIPAGVLTTSGTAEQPIGSDAFFEGGQGHDIAIPANLFTRDHRPPTLVGGSRPELYKGWRTGRFSYRLPVPDGRYRVRLSFFEPDPAINPGERVFDVRANGQTVIEKLDVQVAAGTSFKIVERSFTVRSLADAIVLQFEPQRGEAIVTAIELEPLR